MSHGLTTVDGNESTRDGDVDLSLSGLLDEGSPAAGDTPSYSTQWGALPFNPQTRVLYFQKHYYSYNSGYTNYTYSNGDYFVWRGTLSVQPDEYRHSSVSTSAANSTDSPLNSNGTWQQSWTLSESGTYLFMMRLAFGTMFSSNDSLVARLQDDTGDFGMRIHMNTEGEFGDVFWGVRTITSSTTFRVIISSISGTVDILERVNREYMSLNIFKIKD